MKNEKIEMIKKDFIDRMSRGEDIESIADNINEEVDSWLPIYNNDIISEWQDMPGDFDNLGAEQLGATEYDIYKLMTLDLYLYYSDYISEIIEELKNNFACNHSDDWQGATCGTCEQFVKACCGMTTDEGNSYCSDCFNNLSVNSL